MAKVLVSLVSDQTIPNVELIKEFENQVERFVFISSEKMRKQLSWIIEACNLTKDKYLTKEVNPYDIKDIELKLNELDFFDDEIIVNITCGTKISLLVVNEFFRGIGATIYYVTGNKSQYLKVFPSRGQMSLTLNANIDLKTYLLSYGFRFEPNIPKHEFEQSEKIFNFYNECSHEVRNQIFEQIRLRREKVFNVLNNQIICEFLESVNYPITNYTLSKKDTKYLSGDWFEEWVYYKIKNDLEIQDDKIATGIEILKEGSKNELDVVFLYEHKLYVIECKTAVYEKREIKKLRNGVEELEIKEMNILGETIYKSDALNKNFGLFATTTIATLDELKNDEGKPLINFEVHFNRAELSKIKIISKRDFIAGSTAEDMFLKP